MDKSCSISGSNTYTAATPPESLSAEAMDFSPASSQMFAPISVKNPMARALYTGPVVVEPRLAVFLQGPGKVHQRAEKAQAQGDDQNSCPQGRHYPELPALLPGHQAEDRPHHRNSRAFYQRIH